MKDTLYIYGAIFLFGGLAYACIGLWISLAEPFLALLFRGHNDTDRLNVRRR